MKCKKCGRNIYALLLLAMAVELGAKASPSPDECSQGGEHDFEEAVKEDLG